VPSFVVQGLIPNSSRSLDEEDIVSQTKLHAFLIARQNGEIGWEQID